MKSQPEVRIRRIAVFTGYEERELGMAFTRPIRRSARAVSAANPVIRLEAVPAVGEVAPLSVAEMWRAA